MMEGCDGESPFSGRHPQLAVCCDTIFSNISISKTPVYLETYQLSLGLYPLCAKRACLKSRLRKRKRKGERTETKACQKTQNDSKGDHKTN